MPKELERLRIGGKEYFIDGKLNQIRNVNNPHDFEDVSPDIIDFWKGHCTQEDDKLVCNLDNAFGGARETAHTIIDVFEEFLEEKGIDIPNEEKKDSDIPANIYGTDYYGLEDQIAEILSEYSSRD